MPRAVPTTPPRWTYADLIEAIQGLGDIPAERIRLDPMPGTATEQDVLDVLAHEGRICELIDGTLVEKAMGYEDGRIAVVLSYYLERYLDHANLGIVNGPDGTLRLTTGLMRVPDLTFISWRELPDGKFPNEPVPRLDIDLAVEIISQSNTDAEMRRKLGEYFDAGVRLVWFVYPRERAVHVHSDPNQYTRLTEDQVLEGGAVLPGFSVSLRELFDRAGRGPSARE